MTEAALLRSEIPGLPVRRGKVRDIYDAGDELLLVATDRLSAFDVVMPTGIPGKGRILTALSAFWFGKLAHLGPTHFLGVIDTDASLPPELMSRLAQSQVAWASGPCRNDDPAERNSAVGRVSRPDSMASRESTTLAQLRGRTTRCRKAEVVPIECVVRGYLAGSGWKEYRETGRVCGVELPPGLVQGSRLPRPIFTPATKAETGHDENISFERAAELVGGDVMRELRDRSLKLYEAASAHAEPRGVIIADTKFEFGWRYRGPADSSASARGAWASGPCEGNDVGRVSNPDVSEQLRAGRVSRPDSMASRESSGLLTRPATGGMAAALSSHAESDGTPDFEAWPPKAAPMPPGGRVAWASGPCDELMLIDEVLTPDSSRFWPAADYRPGREQPSFDKQFVRDHLERLVAAGQWNKSPPGPELPAEVVRGTLQRYEEALARLTG